LKESQRREDGLRGENLGGVNVGIGELKTGREGGSFKGGFLSERRCIGVPSVKTEDKWNKGKRVKKPRWKRINLAFSRTVVRTKNWGERCMRGNRFFYA